MHLVTIEQARAQVAAMPHHDAQLELYVGAAEQAAEDFLNRRVYPTTEELAAAVLGGSAGEDPNGALRFTRVVAPESYGGAPAFDLGEAALAEDLLCVPDDAPNLTRRMAYRPNAQALAASDLVTDVVDVPQWRRDELAGLFRAQVYGAGALHPHYRRADAADPVIALFWRAADAQAEIDRVVAIYREQRFFYRVSVRGDQELAPRPGQIGRITYSRYGLAAGKLVQVRRVERNPATGDVVLTVWG